MLCVAFGPTATDSGLLRSSSSSDNGADSIPSNIAPWVKKQMYTEKAVQQTMNSNFG